MGVKKTYPKTFSQEMGNIVQGEVIQGATMVQEEETDTRMEGEQVPESAARYLNKYWFTFFFFLFFWRIASKGQQLYLPGLSPIDKSWLFKRVLLTFEQPLRSTVWRKGLFISWSDSSVNNRMARSSNWRRFVWLRVALRIPWNGPIFSHFSYTVNILDFPLKQTAFSYLVRDFRALNKSYPLEFCVVPRQSSQ